MAEEKSINLSFDEKRLREIVKDTLEQNGLSRDHDTVLSRVLNGVKFTYEEQFETEFQYILEAYISRGEL